MKTSAWACNALPARAISRRTRKLLFDPVENRIGTRYPGGSLLTLWKEKLWRYLSNTDSMSFAFVSGYYVEFTYVDHFIRKLTRTKSAHIYPLTSFIASMTLFLMILVVITNSITFLSLWIFIGLFVSKTLR